MERLKMKKDEIISKIPDAEKDINFVEASLQVRYEGDTGFYDGLTYGKVYTVIDENETQFVVDNDVGGKSEIQKTKFNVV
jgi:hypothetical protein